MKTTLLNLLATNWGWILFRGIIAILFGIMAFTWPLLTLKILVILYGAYALTDGIFALIAAFKGGGAMSRWWLALVGILGIAAGIAVFLWPGLSALVLLTLIGVTAIVRGILEIIGALSLRKEIVGEWVLILGGLASIAFGAMVVMFPGGGAVAMVWLIAAYAIAFGLLLSVLAFRLKKHRHDLTAA